MAQQHLRTLDSTHYERHKPSFPELNKWITHAPGVFGSAPWPCMLMSWGNLVVELVLPFMATMSLTEGRRSSIVRWLFTVGAVLFHVAVFLMMGPNFLRQIVLFILASNPLQCLEKSEAPKPPMLVEQASIGDRLRGIYGIFIFAMWWRTSWCSDVDHLTGRTPWNKNHRDPFFPFSNFDMFAIAGKNSNYWVTAVLLIVMVGMQLVKIPGDVAFQLLNRMKDASAD